MANHASAKKRARQTPKRAKINSDRRSRIKTFVKKIEQALLAGNYEEAAAAFKKAQPELQRGVAKGVVNKKTASRKLSRLSARIKAVKNPSAEKKVAEKKPAAKKPKAK